MTDVPTSNEYLGCKWTNPKNRTLRIDASKYELPGAYSYEDVPLAFFAKKEHIDKIQNLELVEDDVVIASYPKTGTTLTQEIVWLLRNNCDTDTANMVYNYARIPYLENCFPPESDGLILLKSLQPPRHLKTHLPWKLCPIKSIINGTGAKAVYVMRNPKDALVSFYYFYCSCASFGQFPGTWHDFFELYLLGKLCYGDHIDHYLGWWKQRHNPNILILKYEEILKDRAGQIRRVAEFLDVVVTEEEVDIVSKHTAFEEMRKNKMTNYTSLPEDIDTSIVPFMRKGQVGDWKNHFTISQNEIMDEIIAKKLAGTELTFDYNP